MIKFNITKSNNSLDLFIHSSGMRYSIVSRSTPKGYLRQPSVTRSVIHDKADL
jgi:hypothetical protein